MSGHPCLGCSRIITGRTYYCENCRVADRHCLNCGAKISNVRHSRLCSTCEYERRQDKSLNGVSSKQASSTEQSLRRDPVLEAHIDATVRSLRRKGVFALTDEIIWGRSIDPVAAEAPDLSDISLISPQQRQWQAESRARRARKKVDDHERNP